MDDTGRPQQKLTLMDIIFPGDAVVILKNLMERNPSITGQVEEIAKEHFGTITWKSVASEMLASLGKITAEQVYHLSGRQLDGRYLYPVETLCEMVDGLLEPHVVRLVRYLRYGLVREADQICTGLLKALHDYEQALPAEIEEMIPNELEAAEYSVYKPWDEYRDKKNRERMATFIEEYLPEWKDWLLEEE